MNLSLFTRRFANCYYLFMFRIFLYSFLVCIFFSAGCNIPVPYYQKVDTIPKSTWASAFKPKYNFNITDTLGHYIPYFIIRHTQAYPFCNIWIQMYIKSPGDSTIKKERINITLSEPSGKWLGRGMGEIYEERVRLDLGDSVKFNKLGTYEIKIEQNMRVDPLPEVLQAGIRIEKRGERQAHSHS